VYAFLGGEVLARALKRGGKDGDSENFAGGGKYRTSQCTGRGVLKKTLTILAGKCLGKRGERQGKFRLWVRGNEYFKKNAIPLIKWGGNSNYLTEFQEGEVGNPDLAVEKEKKKGNKRKSRPH